MLFKQELFSNKFTYEITKERFNKLMEIKKTAQRYDKNGKKKMKIDFEVDENGQRTGKAISAKFNTIPIRIKSEYLKGPFCILFISTDPQISREGESDHYTRQAIMVFEEGEGVRVYRDSLNDGYKNAKFCDDTTMLMMVGGARDDRRYFKVDGEPTCINNFIIEHENESMRNMYEDLIKKYTANAIEETGLAEDKVYVVIQLENT